MEIKERSPIVAILLTFVTCGIYGIYWAVMMMREAVSVKDPSDNGLLEIVLVLFLQPVGFFLAEKKLAEGCAAKNILHKDNSLLYIILGFLGLGIVNFCMMQSALNDVAKSNR